MNTLGATSDVCAVTVIGGGIAGLVAARTLAPTARVTLLEAAQELRDADLKTSRAWAIKEHFRRFWDYAYTSTAEQFFLDWLFERYKKREKEAG